ncbi:MAG TPA: LacI family DNA-binding transcriptional regulator [Capillimicrobium sp.]|nr:LacI family DNA-binding transcriptional regulator [Capillimicrobium sp.]
MGLTIRDVARAAGVSPSTVSHALSGKRTVSATTRARIERVIEELGYRPNQVAASMTTGRTLTLGMLVPDIANPYFGQLVANVERTAGARGYTVVVGSSELDAELEARHVRRLVDRQVDALVYLGGTDAPNPAVVDAARQRPVVAVDEPFSWLPESAATITVDNRVGGMLAAQHLIGLGHERLAVVAGPAGLPTARDRTAGFVDAAERAGREPVVRSADNYTVDAGRRVGATLLTTDADVTGVFCANDLIALGVMQVAAELGRRVPSDLALVGFDDMFVSTLVTPALTTVRQPLDRIGREAAELAIALAAGESGLTMRRVLPVDLVVRGSTAART